MDVKVIGKVLKPTFVGDLGGEEEETKSNGRCFDRCSENGGKLADEFEDARNFGLPVRYLERKVEISLAHGKTAYNMILIFISSTKLNRRGNESWKSKPHPFTAKVEVFSCNL